MWYHTCAKHGPGGLYAGSLQIATAWGCLPRFFEARMESDDQSLCAQVRAFIQHSLAGDDLAPAPAEFVAHIVACERCRGALGLVAAATLAAPQPIGCDDCQAEMAAFIEREADHGFAAAMRALPAVGWHVWGCQDCAQTYQLTRALLAAEARGALAPLPLPVAAAPRRLPAIRLARAFLNLALPPPLALRPITRGIADDTRVLYAETFDRRHVSISIARQPDDCGTLMASITPAALGQLWLRLGDYVASASFNTAGQAQLPGLPAALLDTPDGPDLLVEVEIAV